MTIRSIDMNSKGVFDAATSAGSMTIEVTRHDVDRSTNSALYDLIITCGPNTYKYTNLAGTGSSGPPAAITDTLVLQSHWGSGVKFTSFTIN